MGSNYLPQLITAYRLLLFQLLTHQFGAVIIVAVTELKNISPYLPNQLTIHFLTLILDS